MRTFPGSFCLDNDSLIGDAVLYKSTSTYSCRREGDPDECWSQCNVKDQVCARRRKFFPQLLIVIVNLLLVHWSCFCTHQEVSRMDIRCSTTTGWSPSKGTRTHDRHRGNYTTHTVLNARLSIPESSFGHSTRISCCTSSRIQSVFSQRATTIAAKHSGNMIQPDDAGFFLRSFLLTPVGTLLLFNLASRFSKSSSSASARSTTLVLGATSTREGLVSLSLGVQRACNADAIAKGWIKISWRVRIL